MSLADDHARAVADAAVMRLHLDATQKERNQARDDYIAIMVERDFFMHHAKAVLAQCDALRTLLADARPLVKGRLMDDPTHGDDSILARIDEALASKP